MSIEDQLTHEVMRSTNAIIQEIKSRLNVEALNSGDSILTQRHLDKHKASPEIGLAVGPGGPQELYEDHFEFHSWFPSGDKVLMSYGNKRAKFSDWKKPCKETLFTLSLEGSIDIIETDCINLQAAEISPDGELAAFSDFSSSEESTWNSRLHLRDLTGHRFHQDVKGLKYVSGNHVLWDMLWRSKVEIRWSSDSDQLVLLKQPYRFNEMQHQYRILKLIHISQLENPEMKDDEIVDLRPFLKPDVGRMYIDYGITDESAFEDL